MSLIQPVTPDTTPAALAALAIREQVQNTFQAIVLNQKEIFRKVWKSPDYSPQEVLNKLGTDAQQLFQLGALNVMTILQTDPSALLESEWKPPFVVEFPGDGTAIVTSTPNP